MKGWRRTKSGRTRLLYDGDCGICRASIDWVERHDRGRRFLPVPCGSLRTEDHRVIGLAPGRCLERVWAVTPGGRKLGGVFAVNLVLWHRFPWSVAVVLIYLLPPLLLLEVAGYALVSRHRRRISRWLRLESCGAGGVE